MFSSFTIFDHEPNRLTYRWGTCRIISAADGNTCSSRIYRVASLLQHGDNFQIGALQLAILSKLQSMDKKSRGIENVGRDAETVSA